MNRLPVILAIATIFSACEKDAKIINDPDPFLINPGEPTLIIAHRGGKSLKPDNTMEAFDNAVRLGVDVLEMDIVLTKDTILVTIHDPTIDATADSTGAVKNYTFEELQQFNFGYHFEAENGSYPYRNNPVRIPSLEAIFKKHPHELMMIEIKDLDERGKLAAEKLLALINKYNMAERVVAFSFEDKVMDHFHSLNTQHVFSGASLTEAISFAQAALAGNDSNFQIMADVLAIPDELPSEFQPLLPGVNPSSDTIIEAAHRHGIAVHYWTVNDRQIMEDLILKGTDGIITDKPDLMQEVLRDLGF